MDERTRTTAETLLDMWAAGSDSDDEASQVTSLTTSMQRLTEVGAIEITTDDEEDELTVDVSPILSAAAITYEWLFAQLSEATGQSEQELLFDLREWLTTVED